MQLKLLDAHGYEQYHTMKPECLLIFFLQTCPGFSCLALLVCISMHVPSSLVTKQGSYLCVLLFPTLPPLEGLEMRGSDNEKGQEETVGRGAFHRHAKTFRGKPSQIFPTVCGEGFASPVTHSLRKC